MQSHGNQFCPGTHLLEGIDPDRINGNAVLVSFGGLAHKVDLVQVGLDGFLSLLELCRDLDFVRQLILLAFVPKGRRWGLFVFRRERGFGACRAPNCHSGSGNRF